MPEGVSIPIIITTEKLPAFLLVLQDFEWLVDVPEEVVGVFRAEVAEGVDVLLDPRRRQSAEEVEEGVEGL